MILQAAETWEADLVAMSTHGRSGVGRWLYGSVADYVLRHSAAPVLLVPAQCERTWLGAPGGAIAASPRRVLLPLDGSRRAEAALGPASTLAATLGARLHLVRVVPPPLYAYGQAIADGLQPYSAYPAGEARPLEGAIRPLGTYRRHAPGSWYAWAIGLGEQPPFQAEPMDTTDLEQASRYLDRLAPEIEAQGLAVDVDAVVGCPASEILTLAERHDVDAIAMSTHGRSGVARLTLGSVATELLQRARVPLLLVGPAAVAWMVPATAPEAEVADSAERPDQAIPAAGRE
jgi:nucleotide-binding universal stress UspA family protein